jgi:hypothetical protein
MVKVKSIVFKKQEPMQLHLVQIFNILLLSSAQPNRLYTPNDAKDGKQL